MIETSQQELPYAGLLQRLGSISNSDEERLRMLERRMTGEVSSPRALTFEGQQLRQVSGESAGPSGRTPVVNGDALSDSNESDTTSETEPSAKRARHSSSPNKTDQAHGCLHASPFRQLTNHPRRHGNSSAKRDKHPKHAPPPGTTPPPTSRTHKPANTINKYFSHRGDGASYSTPVAHVETQTDASYQHQQDAMQHQLHAAQSDVEQARQNLAQLEQKLQRSDATVQQLEEQLKAAQQLLQTNKDTAATKESAVRAAVAKLANKAASTEMDLLMLQLQAEGSRLGQLGVSSSGLMGLHEVWEDGQAFKDLQRRMKALVDSRASIEAARKGTRRQLPPPAGPCDPNAASPSPQPSPRQLSHSNASSRTVPSACSTNCITPEQYVAADEIFKARLGALKREEEWLHKEQERLESDKVQHISERRCRQLKRVRDQERSRFQAHAVLNNRYLLMNLLGKGGFSEVYKAFDMQELCEVAVKLHQLNSSWSDVKKASYVKHAVREYKIHRQLKHSKVVALLDIFELDSCTFATVLELCEGGDLDLHLQRHHVLPEKEGRAIASQIFDGLSYLNSPSRRIIHYDLKPANILFDQLGEVKITDFGLSKIVEDDQFTSMELTSQGAGTYWYLPPECFEVGTQPPSISNRVDVWSAGVMLYQMLFGKRPFGEGCSQEKILRDEVMLNARTVTFPAKPSISAEGKDFISRCLAYRQQDRLDVQTAAAHPYLALKRPSRPSTGADKAARD